MTREQFRKECIEMKDVVGYFARKSVALQIIGETLQGTVDKEEQRQIDMFLARLPKIQEMLSELHRELNTLPHSFDDPFGERSKQSA